MMQWLRKVIENKWRFDLTMVSVVMAILLCISIVGVLQDPGSQMALVMLFFSGGFVNILSGMQLYRKKKQRNQGMSMILLGVVILVIGFYVL